MIVLVYFLLDRDSTEASVGLNLVLELEKLLVSRFSVELHVRGLLLQAS